LFTGAISPLEEDGGGQTRREWWSEEDGGGQTKAGLVVRRWGDLVARWGRHDLGKKMSWLGGETHIQFFLFFFKLRGTLVIFKILTEKFNRMLS
jgi:hypothetical protein